LRDRLFKLVERFGCKALSWLKRIWPNIADRNFADDLVSLGNRNCGVAEERRQTPS